MNILPKKSWHVRNKDNVAKVRKDEEEAANQEKKRLQQIALAEQEARTELLRKKARKQKHDGAFMQNVISTSGTSKRPINFFQEVDAEGRPYSLSAKNEEHEKEKQLEKEKAEKKLGVLTYLGQSAVETLPDDELPWYLKPRKRDSNNQEMTKSQLADMKRKSQLDPLNDIEKHLKKKKKHKHEHKKQKQTKTSSSQLADYHSKNDKLAKLRKERMEREAKEKQKSLQLLQKHYGSTDTTETSSSSFTPKFSNQFNPRLARNNKYS